MIHENTFIIDFRSFVNSNFSTRLLSSQNLIDWSNFNLFQAPAEFGSSYLYGNSGNEQTVIKEDAMNKHIKIAAGILSFLAMAVGGVYAQATVTGHISAEVVEALTVGETSSMNFGRFTTGNPGGSITIPTNGTAITANGVVPADSNITPATFSVSGANNATFAVTLPQGPTTLTDIVSGNTLVVSNWTASDAQGTTDFVLAGGTGTVKVGATLQVGNSPKGTYTGSYQVTFAYN